MERLRREDKIFIDRIGVHNFRVKDIDGDVHFKEKDDFFIYFRSVSFKQNGTLEGRYLGVNPEKILDNKCKPVFYSELHNWHYADCEEVRTARMVAVKNKTGVIIIIQS